MCDIQQIKNFMISFKMKRTEAIADICIFGCHSRQNTNNSIFINIAENASTKINPVVTSEWND